MTRDSSAASLISGSTHQSTHTHSPSKAKANRPLDLHTTLSSSHTSHPPPLQLNMTSFQSRAASDQDRLYVLHSPSNIDLARTVPQNFAHAMTQSQRQALASATGGLNASLPYHTHSTLQAPLAQFQKVAQQSMTRNGSNRSLHFNQEPHSKQVHSIPSTANLLDKEKTAHLPARQVNYTVTDRYDASMLIAFSVSPSVRSLFVESDEFPLSSREGCDGLESAERLTDLFLSYTAKMSATHGDNMTRDVSVSSLSLDKDAVTPLLAQQFEKLCQLLYVTQSGLAAVYELQCLLILSNDAKNRGLKKLQSFDALLDLLTERMKVSDAERANVLAFLNSREGAQLLESIDARSIDSELDSTQTPHAAPRLTRSHIDTLYTHSLCSGESLLHTLQSLVRIEGKRFLSFSGLVKSLRNRRKAAYAKLVESLQQQPDVEREDNAMHTLIDPSLLQHWKAMQPSVDSDAKSTKSKRDDEVHSPFSLPRDSSYHSRDDSTPAAHLSTDQLSELSKIQIDAPLYLLDQFPSLEALMLLSNQIGEHMATPSPRAHKRRMSAVMQATGRKSVTSIPTQQATSPAAGRGSMSTQPPFKSLADLLAALQTQSAQAQLAKLHIFHMLTSSEEGRALLDVPLSQSVAHAQAQAKRGERANKQVLYMKNVKTPPAAATPSVQHLTMFDIESTYAFTQGRMSDYLHRLLLQHRRYTSVRALINDVRSMHERVLQTQQLTRLQLTKYMTLHSTRQRLCAHDGIIKFNVTAAVIHSLAALPFGPNASASSASLAALEDGKSLSCACIKAHLMYLAMQHDAEKSDAKEESEYQYDDITSLIEALSTLQKRCINASRNVLLLLQSTGSGSSLLERSVALNLSVDDVVRDLFCHARLGHSMLACLEGIEADGELQSHVLHLPAMTWQGFCSVVGSFFVSNEKANGRTVVSTVEDDELTFASERGLPLPQKQEESQSTPRENVVPEIMRNMMTRSKADEVHEAAVKQVKYPVDLAVSIDLSNSRSDDDNAPNTGTNTLLHPQAHTLQPHQSSSPSASPRPQSSSVSLPDPAVAENDPLIQSFASFLQKAQTSRRSVLFEDEDRPSAWNEMTYQHAYALFTHSECATVDECMTHLKAFQSIGLTFASLSEAVDAVRQKQAGARRKINESRSSFAKRLAASTVLAPPLTDDSESRSTLTTSELDQLLANQFSLSDSLMLVDLMSLDHLKFDSFSSLHEALTSYRNQVTQQRTAMLKILQSSPNLFNHAVNQSELTLHDCQGLIEECESGLKSLQKLQKLDTIRPALARVSLEQLASDMKSCSLSALRPMSAKGRESLSLSPKHAKSELDVVLASVPRHEAPKTESRMPQGLPSRIEEETPHLSIAKPIDPTPTESNEPSAQDFVDFFNTQGKHLLKPVILPSSIIDHSNVEHTVELTEQNIDNLMIWAGTPSQSPRHMQGHCGDASEHAALRFIQ